MKYYFYFYLAGRQPARPTEVQKTFRIFEKNSPHCARKNNLKEGSLCGGLVCCTKNVWKADVYPVQNFLGQIEIVFEGNR